MGRAIAGMILTACLCRLAHTQPAKPPVFEVASVKPSALPNGKGVIRPGMQGGPGTGDPGRVTYSFSTIRDLLVDAYTVKRSQITGGPNWMDSERFDIVAKVPEGATKDQVKLMLQNLLVDRFQLTLHRETKELPVYALIVSAKGPKLKDSTGTQAPAPAQPVSPNLRGMKIGPDGCPELPPMAASRGGNFMMMTPNGECVISKSATMDSLAAQLSNGFDRPVIDQTGLKGKYDLRLRYDPSSMPGAHGGPKDVLDPAPAGGDAANPPPSIFIALQEQLGLKLEARKGPVDLLVIDHVQKTPTRN